MANSVARQSLLQKFYQSEFSELIQEIADEAIAEVEKRSVVGTSEFETVRLAFEKEYTIKGIREFTAALYRLSHKK